MDTLRRGQQPSAVLLIVTFSSLWCVFRWIAYDFDNRYTHCERLLRQVRMGLLTNDAFFRILNYHKLTTASPAVHSVLLDASRLMGQPEVSPCTPRRRRIACNHHSLSLIHI